MLGTSPPHLTKPGLFVTATDTDVGKTVITCAIAKTLVDQGRSVGVCKPFATGCDRNQNNLLVSPDAQALAHFATARWPLDVINPIRYALPVAPAVAASQSSSPPPDYGHLRRCLETIDEASDVVLVEGVGGLLVPLDDQHHTVLDLAVGLGYPVVVVTRPGLGTLNHTAMTVRLLQQAGCRVAGLVVNGCPVPHDPAAVQDASLATNAKWLEQMNRVPILATVPVCPPHAVSPETGRIPTAVIQAVASVRWEDLLQAPSHTG